MVAERKHINIDTKETFRALKCCFSMEQDEQEREEGLLSGVRLAMPPHCFQTPHYLHILEQHRQTLGF